MIRFRRLSMCLSLVLGVLMTAGVASAAPAPHYRAIDLGTLGGPNSLPDDPGISISPSGTVLGSADVKTLNPFRGIPGYPPVGCLGIPCHANHAFEWHNGVITDLGTLGGYNSGIFELNGSGVGAGFSETGAIDPLTSFPEAHAAISMRGRLHDLGTLGGNESWASGINNRGQVSGFADNTTPDPYAAAFGPYHSATAWHATLWRSGHAHDLGTLGGPDSVGGLLNARGEVAGESFTNFIPHPSNGGFPTLHPFLWQRGRMRDLGSLGGTFGFSAWMNSRGEVVGVGSLAGDNTVHPFLWNGKRLVDLGTLGGKNGFANWVNDNGTVVGGAQIRRSRAFHGFLWRHGTMLDLPPAPSDRCTVANAINNRGQAVGADSVCGGDNVNAMLWENGQAYNLNNLIPPTPLHLTEAFFISPRGQIACIGTLPNGDSRVVLVTPAGNAVPRTNVNRPVTSRAVPTPDVRDNGASTWREGRIFQRFAPTLP